LLNIFLLFPISQGYTSTSHHHTKWGSRNITVILLAGV